MGQPRTLLEDSLQIWRAGVAAVDSAALVRRTVRCWKAGITLGPYRWLLHPESRICVVGGGKAGVGMTQGLLAALGPQWASRVSGWVNVPDGGAELARATADWPATLTIHDARPPGVNEPTARAVAGAEHILKLVSQLRPRDLCIVLLSGGGSALLPAPVAGISLDDKIALTRALSLGGASIVELNTVRKCLSRIKGGGLRRACRAGTLITLIISDVAGDPVDIIASGPTAQDEPDRLAALRILEEFASRGMTVPKSVFEILRTPASSSSAHGSIVQPEHAVTTRARSEPAVVGEIIVGNNQTAVEAAADCARRRGYVSVATEWDRAGVAREEGRRFADWIMTAAQCPAFELPVALISGGEPTVALAAVDGPRAGGRNQELVLSLGVELLRRSWPASNADFAFCSGGTDGEDGPTDAAGGWLDAASLARWHADRKLAEQHLARNDSYPFLQQHDQLLMTGPTQTNVMDLRVSLVDRAPSREE